MSTVDDFTSTTVSITLNNLLCVAEDNLEKTSEGTITDVGSDPYIWPAVVLINTNTLAVNVLGPDAQHSHTVIKTQMRAGQSAPIPNGVNFFSLSFNDDLTNYVIVLAIALWQRYDSPSNSTLAGLDAFTSGLQENISNNLVPLGSTDQAMVDATIKTIKTAVKNKVESAISNSLSEPEKIEVWANLLTLDAIIDNSSTVFKSIVPTSFQVYFNELGGGNLLLFRDKTQNGTGDVDTPQTIGQGGWGNFKFVFSGGNGIIYAVDQEGKLLFFHDPNQDSTQGGSQDVQGPKTIGLGGWADFKFLFSGGNGIIYAVDQAGKLLFYRDKTQNGTGDVDTPQTIGQGGWADFKFLFSGGNGFIYAAQDAVGPGSAYEIDSSLNISSSAAALVPNVYESNQTTASTTISEAGFIPKFSIPQQYEGYSASNLWVISQEPTAGSVAALGWTITMELTGEKIL